MSKHIDVKVSTKFCRGDKHNFMPISWRVSASSRSATEFACSYCMTTIEKRDLEVINCCRNEEIDKDIEKAQKKVEEDKKPK